MLCNYSNCVNCGLYINFNGTCGRWFPNVLITVLEASTHCSQDTRKMVIGKQCRPRSESAECCPMETICMKCQSLFSGKNEKNIINLSSAEFTQRVVKVNSAFKELNHLPWVPCRLKKAAESVIITTLRENLPDVFLPPVKAQTSLFIYSVCGLCCSRTVSPD